MKTFAYKHESLTAEYHLHAKQMTNRRVQCLVEANKRGLTLYYDPPTVQNRCFYRCLAKFLDITEDDVVEMVESFMISNQVISCKNKVRLFRQWLYAFTKIQVCGDINKNPLLVTLLSYLPLHVCYMPTYNYQSLPL